MPLASANADKIYFKNTSLAKGAILDHIHIVTEKLTLCVILQIYVHNGIKLFLVSKMRKCAERSEVCIPKPLDHALPGLDLSRLAQYPCSSTGYEILLGIHIQFFNKYETQEHI